mmetsp:Transcript_27489/g.88761  ORF Transcript_27489/g.88761 Transcript_27489/m.88761 type:complete len:291 (-) Transcript_27489:1134-2006(-)
MASSRYSLARRSRWLVGSSSTSRLARESSMRAMHSRVRSPPERADKGSACASDGMPILRIVLRRASSLVPPASISIHSHAVCSPRSACAASCGKKWSCASSPRRTCPAAMGYRPVAALRRVDLPAPLSPTSSTTSPLSTVRHTAVRPATGSATAAPPPAPVSCGAPRLSGDEECPLAALGAAAGSAGPPAVRAPKSTRTSRSASIGAGCEFSASPPISRPAAPLPALPRRLAFATAALPVSSWKRDGLCRSGNGGGRRPRAAHPLSSRCVSLPSCASASACTADRRRKSE